VDYFRILGLLHLDRDLDVSATVTLLTSVAMEICLRLREYREWPFAAFSLCRDYNQDGYLMACLNFLHTPDDQLDTGFGSALKKLALRSGAHESAHLQYLVSEPVQQAISLAFRASAVSSLPVERAFAETKRQEAPRLYHVATASRNQIIRQFLRQRSELLQQAVQASAALRSSLKTNVASLAWELQPRLADFALNRQCSQPMKEFIEANKPALQAEVERRSNLAQSALSRLESSECPLTQAQWINWFRKNQTSFIRA